MLETGGYTFRTICGVLGAPSPGPALAQYPVQRLAFDSRKVLSGHGVLFFALSSAHSDGHAYIPELWAKGVKCFVVEKLPEPIADFPEAGFVVVRNSLAALQQLAAWHRRQFHCPVIGITGSNGKTVVKEWLFQLLAGHFRIVRSPQSFNSQLGVPLSVWMMDAGSDLALFEAGISQPGEMQKLEEIIRPTIGVFTHLGHAHDAGFEGMEQKLQEKILLFRHCKTLIYPSDPALLDSVITQSPILQSVKKFRWGLHPSSDLVIRSIELKGAFSEVKVLYANNAVQFMIPFADQASVENALSCFATLLVMGFKPEVAAASMPHIHALGMRLELKEGVNHCSIINDSYSNDLDSLGIALNFLKSQSQHPSHTVILSDILQSGLPSDQLYAQVAMMIEAHQINRFIAIGRDLTLHRGQFGTGPLFYPDTEAFLHEMDLDSFHDQTILIKGARSFGFERITERLQQQTHETVLEINLNAIVHNLNYFKRKVGPDVKVMAMVKAFSYGSGSHEIASLLQYHKVDYLTVAYIDEGVSLRKAGITLPIMVMNPEVSGFESLLRYQLEPEVYSFRLLQQLSEYVQKVGLAMPLGIHIKFDTGMHRLGFEPSQVDELVQRLQSVPDFELRSVFSHLATADDPSDKGFAEQQIALFRQVSDQVVQAFPYKILRHIANTAASMAYPEARFDMVRLGIGLYGVSPYAAEQAYIETVSALRSVVSQLHPLGAGESVGYSRRFVAKQATEIAVVPIGYADGLHRILGEGRGHLMLRGQLVPIVGSVCMDMLMLDVTGMGVKEGERVEVFGTERPIAHLAHEMQTIPYEILTGISQRVKRVYFKE